ncbi:hypothetical protein, partial [Neisseria sp. HMSC064E01]|uniref:hypothetical protein n=1 Tax=Neisseria sp. HMSC064E01 TaxID=1715052 RepID=UPI001AEF6423
RGGGLGRGHSLNFGNLSQHPNCPYKPCGLLPLSHGREDGRLLGLRILQGKQVVQAAFYFSDDLHQRL